MSIPYFSKVWQIIVILIRGNKNKFNFNINTQNIKSMVESIFRRADVQPFHNDPSGRIVNLVFDPNPFS